MSPFKRGISASMLSGTWMAALSLAITPALIHLYGIESYGLIGFYMAALAIGGIIDVSLSATTSREIAWLLARPDEKHKIGSLLHSIEVLYWAIIVAITIMLLGAIGYSDEYWLQSSTLTGPQVGGALTLLVISLSVYLPSGLYASSLTGMNRQALSSLTVAGFGTARLVGAVAIALYYSNDIRSFFVWQVGVGIAQVIVLRHLAWRKVENVDGGRAFFSTHVLQLIKKAAGAMFVITTLGILLSQLDKIIIGYILPLESLGHYTLAWSAAAGIAFLATPINQAYSVRFSAVASAGKADEFAPQIITASQFMWALIMPVSIVIAIFSKDILTIWIGNTEVAEASALSLSILALGTAIMLCTYTMLNAMYARRRFNPVLVVQFTSFLIFGPFLYFMIYSIGIVGAAWSWMLYATVISVVYVVLVTRRDGGLKVGTTLVRSFSLISLSSAAIGVAVQSATAGIENDFLVVGAIILSLLISWFIAVLMSENIRTTIFQTLIRVVFHREGGRQ